MRGPKADASFWGRNAETETDWMDDLSSESTDTAESHALDEFAAAKPMAVDPVFHELSEVTIGPPPAPPAEDVTEPVAASEAEFDWAGFTDDLLPSWKLDLD